jgi:hypothetical protein
VEPVLRIWLQVSRALLATHRFHFKPALKFTNTP